MTVSDPVFFWATSRYLATTSERILCVVKEREGLTKVNDTVFLVRSLSFGCYVDLEHDIQNGCSPGKCRTDTCTKSTEWYIWSVQVDVFSLQDRRCTTICSQVTWRSLICHQPKSHFPWIKCFLIGFYWHFPGWHPTFVQRGKAFDSLELSGAPRLRCLRLSGCKGLQTRQLHHGGKLGGFRAWWWMGLKNRALKVWWFLLCFLKKVVEGWWKVNEGILFFLRLRWRWSSVNEFLILSWYYTWNTCLFCRPLFNANDKFEWFQPGTCPIITPGPAKNNKINNSYSI